MRRLLAAIGLTLIAPAAALAATITILPGAGFNDATAVTPAGGNTATTLGQARLKLFQKAADVWAQRLVSAQTIYVSADFTSLPCSSSQGVLGQAQSNGFFKNFTGAPKANVYYPEALAFALAGSRFDGTNPAVTPSDADIIADFNSAIDSDPSCLGGRQFYYGFDNTPGGKIDLLNVVVHELGHGLGFSSFVDETTGKGADPSNPNQLGIYDQFVFDETQNKAWPVLSQSQRVSSAINDGHLVWNGAAVNAARSVLASGVTAAGHVQLYAPNPDEPGSSVSHWDDPAVSPHLLMQPFAHSDIKASQGVDMTSCALKDMGWRTATGVSCPDNLTGNNVPVASPQTLQVTQNTSQPLTLTATDADGDALTYAITTAPAHGSLTGTAPNLNYVPANNFSGSDSLKFVANDGKANSAPATVSINVTKVNHAPVAAAQNVAVNKGSSIHLVLSATDSDGDALTYSVVANPAHGALSGTPPNVTYQPAAGYAGADSFTFRANDGTVDSNTATVSITVINHAPVAAAQTVTVTQDTAKAISLSATDSDGDALTYSVVANPAHGVLSGTPPNVTYQPAAGYAGTDSFTFRATDTSGADSNIATVGITMTNHAPVAAAQTVAVTQDTAKAISLSATDSDGGALTYSVVANPAHGALSGTPPNVTYQPAAGYAGADSFTFKANDGAADSNTATVSINVAAAANGGSGSGGGGGAMPNLLLPGFLLLWRRMRRRAAKRH